LEAEGDDTRAHPALTTYAGPVLVEDPASKIVNAELRRVEDLLGPGAKERQSLALEANAVENGDCARAFGPERVAQRVRPPGAAEATQECFVGGVEKQDVHLAAPGDAHGFDDFRGAIEKPPDAHVDPHCDAADAARFARGECLRHDGQWQVVDAEETEV